MKCRESTFSSTKRTMELFLFSTGYEIEKAEPACLCQAPRARRPDLPAVEHEFHDRGVEAARGVADAGAAGVADRAYIRLPAVRDRRGGDEPQAGTTSRSPSMRSKWRRLRVMSGRR